MDVVDILTGKQKRPVWVLIIQHIIAVLLVWVVIVDIGRQTVTIETYIAGCFVVLLYGMLLYQRIK